MTKSAPNRKAKKKRASKARAMPKFTKAPAALTTAFSRAVGDLPDVESRQMFGYPAAFTKSQMFAGVFQDQMILRLGAGDRESIGQKGARPFEPMPGRPMREYVTVPDAVRDSPAELHSWLVKAHAYAASLPPKKKR